MLKKQKIVQEEAKKQLLEEYIELLKNKNLDIIIKNYIGILKVQYDESTLNQGFLKKIGYLRTLYLALIYDLHYCRSKVLEFQNEKDSLKEIVYEKYLNEYIRFSYIISRLIILESGVVEREKRCIDLEKILSEREVEKQKKKYTNPEVEDDYNFELCLKLFSLDK